MNDSPWEPFYDLLIDDSDDDMYPHQAKVCSICGCVVHNGLRDRHMEWHRQVRLRGASW